MGHGESNVESVNSAVLKQFGFNEEVAEEARSQFIPTGFPEPLKRLRVIWEAPNLSMEEAYFWTLNYARQDHGFPYVDKTMDIFSAAENSAFFGTSQQRIGLQQDKVSQFLATIGKMVKELFQLVRELRIIDERLDHYEDSYHAQDNKREASEISLKGIFIDMVEGGAKNSSSVYGMARELQFTTLPDLFFSTHPQKASEVDEFVDKYRGGFNRKVREVLKRKLKSYLIWKERTYDELKVRRTFTLKYLRQHFDIIYMYLEWVRPYLRNIQRLHMDPERTASPDLVTAFEGSMVEVEFLAYMKPAYETKSSKYLHVALLCHFLYRTTPTMSYQQEGYQRGPIHVGKVTVTFRSYVWTKKQIENYKKMRLKQDFELMKSISESVRVAIEALGDELMNYLEQAGEKFSWREHEKKPEKKVEPKPQGLRKFFGLAPAKDEKSKEPENEKDSRISDSEKKFVQERAYFHLADIYKYFKKNHKMMHWN